MFKTSLACLLALYSRTNAAATNKLNSQVVMARIHFHASLTIAVSIRKSSATGLSIVMMEVTKYFAVQIPVKATPGFAATTITAFPRSGRVTEAMTAWTGVTRLDVNWRRRWPRKQCKYGEFR